MVFLMVNRSMQIVDDLEIFSHVSMIADEDSGRLLSYVLLASQSVQLSIMSLTMTRPDERIFADNFCSNVSHRLVRQRADRMLMILLHEAVDVCYTSTDIWR